MRKLNRNEVYNSDRPTLRMSRAELDAMLDVDAAVGARGRPQERPTVQMKAVSADLINTSKG